MLRFVSALVVLSIFQVSEAVGAPLGSNSVVVDRPQKFSVLPSILEGVATVEIRITKTSELFGGYKNRIDETVRPIAEANQLLAEQLNNAAGVRHEHEKVLAGLDARDRSRLEDEEEVRRSTSNMIRKIASSHWVCPVDGEMQFRDSWGEPRSGGRVHDGVDIVARSRTPVLAPEAGIVKFRWDLIGGRSFDLFTWDGDYYFGTHLRSYGTGGLVEAGEVIGYVGQTGNARGYHLHFEYHPGGKGNSVNPYFLVHTHCR